MIKIFLGLMVALVSSVVQAQSYPVEGLAKIQVIRCEVDTKSTVKGVSGSLSRGTYQREEHEMDMLTFYCQVHAEFDGEVYLIALRTPNPPKRDDTVSATLMDEYTLILDTTL